MALGLTGPNASHLLIFNGTQGEGQGGEALVHLGDEVPGLLRLEHVVRIHSPLEHSGPDLRLLALAFSCRHHDIEAVDFVQLELELFDLIILGLATDDGPVAVDDMLLQLVGENSLRGLATELSCDLGEGLGDRSVLVPDLDKAQCSLCTIPSRADDVGPLVLHGRAADNQSVGRCRDEAVDVARQVDLHHIPLLQLPRLTLEGRVVAKQLVHRDASGKRDTLLNLLVLDLLVVELACLLLDHLIAGLTEFDDVCIHDALGDHGRQGLVHDLGSGLVLGGDVRAAEVGDLLGLGLVVAHCY
mmetsp:Transcript_16629/g.35148  ORF Transcript_16629/g.35148 Transcript_16629/m.35148 type:complete len:301 (+) Transcript_16629:403-1305(+)